ncbi:MAG: sugar phosphate isomerase/epimerase [Fimbriimonadaceae bacterium]
MAKIPIGLQLYSVRRDCAEDLFGTIEKVAKMGYEGVEFAGFHGKAAADIKKCLDDNGLKCCGSHTGWDTLKDDQFSETVEFHDAIGCDNLIVPWIPEELRNTPDACRQTAEVLTALTEKCRAVGKRTGFHVHGGDVKPLEGGKSAWYLLGEGTPSDFILQWDTANGLQGGSDPVQPLLDFPGRGITTHLKEYDNGKWPVMGKGAVPWPKVFEACETVAGTTWYIVEHESDAEMTPLEAVEACLQFLRASGK